MSYYDTERFSVVANGGDWSVIDKQNGNAIHSRHRSQDAAHKQARTLNKQEAK